MARTVVITGTSTGIGRACVERMAAEGWTVYAGVRRQADGDDLAASIPGVVRPVLLDVTLPEQVTALAQRLATDLGHRGLDALVNNAGVSGGGPIETLTDEEWQAHFDVNVFGVVRTTRELLPLVRTAKGRIVNVASIAGRVATPMLGPYCAGKHAVEAISEALRFEVADQGVRVACVEPGEVRSAIWSKADDQITQVTGGMSPEVLERYRRQVDLLIGFVAEGTKRSIPASKVADAVHHALTADRPKHRYLVGPDAKLVGVVSRMPDTVRARMLGLNAARWARSGRKQRERA